MEISKTGYGVDVSSKRADELEKRLLSVVCEQIAAGRSVNIIDLGCGAGGAAARLLAAGAEVTGVDNYDFSSNWSQLDTGLASFTQGDIRDLESLLDSKKFDMCLCNRTLHYVTYEEAKEILLDLRNFVDSTLYVSFSGLTSELARGYDAGYKPVESRFGLLALEDQEIFGITQPLTLYSEEEARNLIKSTGWQLNWCRTTDFGNILIVAS